LSAQTLAQRVRAFNPFPGAATALAGEAVKVWMAQADTLGAADADADAADAADADAVPGQVLSVADGIRVQTGDGVLVLTELQRAGGKRLPAADFLRGFALVPGQVLDAAPTQPSARKAAP
jgi:methionyl-tRNA formyltransferase